MSEYYYSSADIRSIIFNAHKIKELHKCPKCDGTGWEHWNGETGDDVKPGRNPYSGDNVFDEGECEKCEGIGYNDVCLYSED